jgi:uncharacterized protein
VVCYLAHYLRIFAGDHASSDQTAAFSLSTAWEFVAALLASPGLAVLIATDRHAEVAAEVISELPHLAGNILHDTHTAILMREHGISQICTRDTDFHQFPFIEMIDPLRS